MQTFAHWAEEHRDSLDDLTAEQRRVILEKLHPTVFLARKGSGRERLALIFSVSEQAAARLDPQTLYSTFQWQDAEGDYFTVYVDEYDPSGSEALRGNTLDLTNVVAAPMEDDSDSSLRDNHLRMLERYASGELKSAAR